MVNAWSLAYDVLNGTMDEVYPIMTNNKITPQESDEYDPIIKLSDTVEHSDAWFDYKRNDLNRENPFSDPKDRERAERVDNPYYVSTDLTEIGNQDITITTDPENTVPIPSPDSPWVYESPDGGKTVARRKAGDDYTKKEVITGDYFDQAKPQPDLNYKSQKYQEDKGIADLKDYVASTYRGHYTNKNSDTQTLDLIHSVGDAESFCRSNALKYLSRYDKKGTAKQDILKAMHYCLLLYYFSGNTKEPDYTNTRYETF